MARTTVYAVRDAETGERLSCCYRTRKEAAARRRELAYMGRVLEVYRTTQDLPRT